MRSSDAFIRWANGPSGLGREARWSQRLSQAFTRANSSLDRGKKVKKLWIPFCVWALCLLLSACGGGEQSPEAQQTTQAAEGTKSILAVAVATAPMGSGLYGYAATTAFPTASTRSTNYWVDVLFATTATPGAPTSSVWPASAVPAYPSNRWDVLPVNLGDRKSVV